MLELTNELIKQIEEKYRDKYRRHNCRLTFMESEKLRNILKMLNITYTKEEYWDIYYRVTWGGTKWKAAIDIKNCEICDYKFKELSEKSGDHIMPVSKGGLEFDLDNIQITCLTCNLKKGAKIFPKGKLTWNRKLSEFGRD